MINVIVLIVQVLLQIVDIALTMHYIHVMFVISDSIWYQRSTANLVEHYVDNAIQLNNVTSVQIHLILLHQIKLIVYKIVVVMVKFYFNLEFLNNF